MKSGSKGAAPAPGEQITSRRALLRAAGAGGAAAVTGVVVAGEARAGHDGTNVLHLGDDNTGPPAPTELDVETASFALTVSNFDVGGGISGISEASDGVRGTHHAGQFGAGVRGVSSLGPGVHGESANGPGMEGRAVNGPGVMALGGEPDGDIEAPGVLGLSFTANGAIGRSESPGHAGVLGESVACLFERGPCDGTAIGTGVLGRSKAGTGVRGESEQGTGVEAASPDGAALRVHGRAVFSTAGTATISSQQSSVFVGAPAVTSRSHITVTLAGHPGSRTLHWVERHPGVGFTVHLTGAPFFLRPPAPATTPLTYLIVEPPLLVQPAQG